MFCHQGDRHQSFKTNYTLELIYTLFKKVKQGLLAVIKITGFLIQCKM